jgi:catechol 2,3-dioxygenase-like lactoylglutathione lyase family enzyme
MNIKHMTLAVRDLEKSLGFYGSYFGFRQDGEHGDGIMLRNSSGFMLGMAQAPEAAKLPDWFHFGFSVDTPENLKALYSRLKSDGVSFRKDLRDDGEEMVFHIFDPDGYRIEIRWDK